MEYEEVCMHLRDAGDDRRRTKQVKRSTDTFEIFNSLFQLN